MAIQHKNLSDGKWQDFSLAEQMGNIGSEISRTLKWKNEDFLIFQRDIDRAIELLDLTIKDDRWQNRLKELIRVRESLADAVFGGTEYKTSLEDLDKYFFHFALAARLNK